MAGCCRPRYCTPEAVFTLAPRRFAAPRRCTLKPFGLVAQSRAVTSTLRVSGLPQPLGKMPKPKLCQTVSCGRSERDVMLRMGPVDGPAAASTTHRRTPMSARASTNSASIRDGATYPAPLSFASHDDSAPTRSVRRGWAHRLGPSSGNAGARRRLCSQRDRTRLLTPVTRSVLWSGPPRAGRAGAGRRDRCRGGPRRSACRPPYLPNLPSSPYRNLMA